MYCASGLVWAQVIVIGDPWVWESEGMIQRFEVTAVGIYEYGIWAITKEHSSFIAWLFLAYRAVTHDGMGLWGDGMVHLSSKTVHWHADQALYYRSVMATTFVSSYVTPIYL